VQETVEIHMNDSLTIVEMSSLTSTVAITGNGALTSVDLGSVTNLDGGGLHINDNDALTTFEGLESLTTAVELSISDNDSLEQLGLSSLTHVEGEFNISGNPTLPTCEAESLLAQLDTTPEYVTISENDDSGICE